MGAINRKHTHTHLLVCPASMDSGVLNPDQEEAVLNRNKDGHEWSVQNSFLSAVMCGGGGSRMMSFPAGLLCLQPSAAASRKLPTSADTHGRYIALAGALVLIALRGFLLWKPFEVRGPCEGRYRSDRWRGASLTEMFEFKHTNT